MIVTGLKGRDFVTCFLCETRCMIVMGLKGRDFCDVFSLGRRLHDDDVTDRGGPQGTRPLFLLLCVFLFYFMQVAKSPCH